MSRNCHETHTFSTSYHTTCQCYKKLPAFKHWSVANTCFEKFCVVKHITNTVNSVTNTVNSVTNTVNISAGRTWEWSGECGFRIKTTRSSKPYLKWQSSHWGKSTSLRFPPISLTLSPFSLNSAFFHTLLPGPLTVNTSILYLLFYPKPLLFYLISYPVSLIQSLLSLRIHSLLRITHNK